MKVNIITLGCSKNTVDSEHLAAIYRQQGHQVFFDRDTNDCDLVAINTCGFIGDAKEESVNTILQQIEAKAAFNRRHRRDGRQRRLEVFGCLVARYRDDLRAEMPEVDDWQGCLDLDITQQRCLSTPQHYAYLKIAEGCNRHCSYCAIPAIRGAHRSRPIEQILDEARSLVAQGVRELIVIAQDTTYYGLDLYGRRTLGTLLDRLATESGAQWIRLHYTYPASFPLDAIEAIRRHDNICNYIDIPLQHISTPILHSMQRGIDRQGTLDLLDHFRALLPDACIRTTLIVGYPGETEQQFDELLDFVRQARFDRMGCFAYSPEEGTPAEALGDPVPDNVKQQRVSRLMALQEQISLEKNQSRVGHEYRVLIDRREGDCLIARTQYDSPDIDDEVIIQAPSDSGAQVPKPGDFCQVRITQALEHDLYAEICEL